MLADFSDTSCLDWRERILRGESLVPDLPLFREEADRAIRNFNRLRVPDMPDMPRMSETAGDWIRKIIEVIFGSFDPVSKQRMIQEFFLLVPKKNGKTLYAAAIMLVAMLMNRRPNSEFILVAPTKEIATRAYRQAARMIKADPELSKMFYPRYHNKAIDLIDPSHAGAGSFLQVLAADLETLTGTTATGVLIDETHVFATNSRAKQVFLEIRGALSARKDGFLIQISTQSKIPPTGVFASELKIARAVRDGLSFESINLKEGVDEDEDDTTSVPLSLLPIIYELPNEIAKDGGWKQKKNWPLVNPNLGKSVTAEFLSRELMKAEQGAPEEMALFASQYFNVEIGLGLNADGWAGALYWEQNAAYALTLEELIEQCEVITAGVDGGGLDDLLSLAFVGRVKGRLQWLHWGKNWAHKIVLERRKSEAPRLLEYEKDKDLVLVNDMTVAFSELADLVATVNKSGKLGKIGFDPMGVGLIVDALALRHISGPDRIEGIPQGWTLQAAIKTSEVKLASGELTHAGQPIMGWAVGNAKVEPIGNAIKITKQAAGTAKIDPLMALFDAVALMSRNPEVTSSGWQTDDVSSLMQKIEAAAAASR